MNTMCLSTLVGLISIKGGCHHLYPANPAKLNRSPLRDRDSPVLVIHHAPFPHSVTQHTSPPTFPLCWLKISTISTPPKPKNQPEVRLYLLKCVTRSPQIWTIHQKGISQEGRTDPVQGQRSPSCQCVKLTKPLLQSCVQCYNRPV